MATNHGNVVKQATFTLHANDVTLHANIPGARHEWRLWSRNQVHVRRAFFGEVSELCPAFFESLREDVFPLFLQVEAAGCGACRDNEAPPEVRAYLQALESWAAAVHCQQVRWVYEIAWGIMRSWSASEEVFRFDPWYTFRASGYERPVVFSVEHIRVFVMRQVVGLSSGEVAKRVGLTPFEVCRQHRRVGQLLQWPAGQLFRAKGGRPSRKAESIA